MLATAIDQAERGRIPTWAVRMAIRALCRSRADDLADSPGSVEFLKQLEGGRLAEVPELANAQHYEVPAAFFRQALGRHLKYSSAVWPEGVAGLDEAEEAMLALTCERAGLRDGDSILELGCGWGSLSHFMARRFPQSRIVAVSNSASQREHILAAGLPNLEVVTADMNQFDPGEQFTRIVSVEMFEHMRDWLTLFSRVSGWLEDGGSLFVHVFCHARSPYLFETEGAGNWMGRHFFSGGLMPSFDLVPTAARELTLEEQWWVSGTHYQRTAAAWRENLERNRAEAERVLDQRHDGEAARWYHRWRLFFLACEELFGFAGGSVWGVGHYRLVKPAVQPAGEQP